MNHFIKLDRALSDISDFKLDFFRNEDDCFDTKVTKLSDTEHNFTDEQLMIFTPAGTKWKEHLHGYTYFGMPIFFHEKYWVGIGKIKIVRHETRNAYPISRIYILEFYPNGLNTKPVLGLNNLLSELGYNVELDITSNLKVQPYGVVSLSITNYAKFLELEKLVLNVALSHFSKGNLFHFSTYLLSKGLLPRYVLSSLKYLAGVNKEIEDTLKDNQKHLIIKNKSVLNFKENEEIQDDFELGYGNSTDDMGNRQSKSILRDMIVSLIEFFQRLFGIK